MERSERVKINVLFFASAREMAGTENTTIDLTLCDGEALVNSCIFIYLFIILSAECDRRRHI